MGLQFDGAGVVNGYSVTFTGDFSIDLPDITLGVQRQVLIGNSDFASSNSGLKWLDDLSRIIFYADANIVINGITTGTKLTDLRIERVGTTLTLTAGGQTAVGTLTGSYTLNTWGYTSGLQAKATSLYEGLAEFRDAGTLVITHDFDQTPGSTVLPDLTGSNDAVLSGFTTGGFVDPTPTPTITITSPYAGQMFQRAGGSKTITVGGVYSDGIDPAPTSISISINSGPLTALDADPSAGVFSGLAEVPAGINTIAVFFTNNTDTTDSVDTVRIGDIVLCAISQSNHVDNYGIGEYTGVAGGAAEFDGTDWVDIDDTPTTSYFAELANLVVADTGIPMGFVKVASGGTSVAQWQFDQSLMINAISEFNAAGGEGAYNLMWIGEQDANLATDETTFKTLSNAAIDHLFTETGLKTVVHGIAQSGIEEDNIRAWLADVASTNANADYGADMSTAFSGLHYDTEPETEAVAAAAWTALQPLYYSPSTFNITISGIPDGSHRIVLDDEAGNRIYDDNVTFASTVATIPSLLDVGTRYYGYWPGTTPPTDGCGITGVTE